MENFNAMDKIQRLKPRYYYRYRCFEIRGKFESSDNLIVRFYVPFFHLESFKFDGNVEIKFSIIVIIINV